MSPIPDLNIGILEAVAKGGALVLLALVLYGFFLLLRDGVAALKEFLTGALDVMRTTSRDIQASYSALAKDVQGLSTQITGVAERISDEHEELSKEVQLALAKMEGREEDSHDRITRPTRVKP